MRESKSFQIVEHRTIRVLRVHQFHGESPAQIFELFVERETDCGDEGEREGRDDAAEAG